MLWRIWSPINITWSNLVDTHLFVDAPYLVQPHMEYHWVSLHPKNNCLAAAGEGWQNERDLSRVWSFEAETWCEIGTLDNDDLIHKQQISL